VHIGVIGHHHPDGFRENISDSLVRMGHRVTHLGSVDGEPGNRFGLSRVRRAARDLAVGLDHRHHRRLARTALARECEAVISVQGRLAPAAVAELRRNRVPVALWFPDSVLNLGRQQLFAAPYTAMFFKDPLLVRRLRDPLGLPAWYLPEACNPRWHRPIGEPATRRAIVVAGNIYPSRAQLLRRLHEAGIPLVLYGPPGRLPRSLPPGLHTGRPIYREEKSTVFRGAAAVLNNLHVAEMAGVNCRLFEATAAGAAVLCERRPALDHLFDPGTEVVPFSEFAELLERARELLADPQLTGKVGDAASRRAHAEHTYPHRLTVLLAKLW
jgi:spore maturation protein CgeB